MVEKIRFEKIYNAIDSTVCTKYEDVIENKEIFIYGLKLIKTDKVDSYISVGCESDELYENHKFFNF